MGAIFKKEFKQNMTNVLGALVILWIVLLYAINFILFTFVLTNPNVQFTYTLECIYGTEIFPLITFIPFFILSLRAYNIERSQGSDVLLYSLPISAKSVVLGKYFASLAIFGISTIPMIFAPLITGLFGSVNYPTSYSTYIAYFLLGCAVLAISHFIACVSKNSALSIIANLIILILTFFLPKISSALSTTAVSSLILLILVSVIIAVIFYAQSKNIMVSGIIGGVLVVASLVVYFVNSTLYEGLIGKIVSAMGIFSQLTTFTNGAPDFSVYVYYITIAAMFVFFTIQNFEKKRWN